MVLVGISRHRGPFYTWGDLDDALSASAACV